MAAVKSQLTPVLQHPAIWRANDQLRDRPQSRETIATGFALLDQALPGGGLPETGLTEILCPFWGCGEMELLSSALALLSQQDRWLAWVNPPWLPYAPALQQQGISLKNVLVIHSDKDKDTLWAMEQCLQSGACGAVLGWPKKLLPQHIRRLQVAAKSGASLGLLMRPQSHLQQPSPAPLRLELANLQQQLQVRVVKCQGHWGSHWLNLRSFTSEAVVTPLPAENAAYC